MSSYKQKRIPPITKPIGGKNLQLVGKDMPIFESNPDMTDKIKIAHETLKEKLSPMAYEVTQNKGTERPFTGEYYEHKEKGTYLCVCCGQDLFSSESKYESGSGWPSYYEPIQKDKVDSETDGSLGIPRTEVLCSRCGAHLGHVFKDGPKPNGLRYCINSLSLDFKKSES